MWETGESRSELVCHAQGEKVAVDLFTLNSKENICDLLGILSMDVWRLKILTCGTSTMGYL